MDSKFKTGDVVMWNDSTYKIVTIDGSSAKLKQLFSIGTILKKSVLLSELTKK